jgi:hypothetical protein
MRPVGAERIAPHVELRAPTSTLGTITTALTIRAAAPIHHVRPERRRAPSTAGVLRGDAVIGVPMISG